MNAREEKPQQINDLAFKASSVCDGQGANDSGTISKSGTELTQPRSGFDLEDTRRALIAYRALKGADTPPGHVCSNLVEQMEIKRDNPEPSWAVTKYQTMKWRIEQQMKRLGSVSQ